MKRIFITSLLASAGSLNAYASDGTINFTGRVSTNACNVQGATIGTSGTPTTTLTIGLGEIGTSGLGTTQGTLAGHQTFRISLSGCAATSGTNALSQVRAAFTGIADTSMPDVLRNTAPSGAAGVGVAIIDTSSNQRVGINGIGTTASYKSLPSSSGNVTMDFQAAYVNTRAQAPGTGPVAAQLNYVIQYN